MISRETHSFELIRRSRECAINVPTKALAETVVRIGNCSGANTDKFQRFGLTAVPARHVQAPLIAECYANIECKLFDDTLVASRSFFIFEAVKANVAVSPKYPKTIHYYGDGEFMVAGPKLSLRRYFKPGML
jgi:flavin reductase (DIM6/NTAB) family NADH-FMN oxidoreductase RutF